MDELAKTVGENLCALRKKKNLTQGQIAEKFNYTDKSISKWEHGESLPDLAVLKELAEFYGVSIDYLTIKHQETQPDLKMPIGEFINKQLVIALSVLFIWSLAAVIFFSFLMEDITIWHGWQAFVWAVPATAVIFLVFDAVWYRHKGSLACWLALSWSTIIAIYIEIGCDADNGWQHWFILLIGLPLTLLLILANRAFKK